jgi:hypothetical protein
VGWGVTQKERDLIVKAARSRHQAGSPADQRADLWPTQRPPTSCSENASHITRSFANPDRPMTKADLLALASAIANASGGIVGFHAVSDEERQILAHISEELKKSGKA